jgi:hypothetical protein
MHVGFCYVSGRGEQEGRNKRGSRSKGLPGSLATRRGACLTKAARGRPKGKGAEAS